MESKQTAQLEQAKAFFYSQKISESYNLLRRYFDRLPFQPEEGHSEYIGIFCRVLAELGKEFELGFYIRELEKLNEKKREPRMAFALAVAYSYSDLPRYEASKELLEFSCKQTSCLKLQAKAKMMLAHLYSLKNDYGAAASVIFSISPTGDLQVDHLAAIWRANVLRAQGNVPAAIDALHSVLVGVDETEDWYVYFSARVVNVLLLAESNKADEANKLLEELRVFVHSKNFKSTREQLKAVEEKLRKQTSIGKVTYEQGFKAAFIYNKKKTILSGTAPADKLLLLFSKKPLVQKSQIIKTIYNRAYVPEDDKLVYYHVHALRQRLKELGLPPEALSTESEGYRFIPEVEILGGGL